MLGQASSCIMGFGFRVSRYGGPENSWLITKSTEDRINETGIKMPSLLGRYLGIQSLSFLRKIKLSRRDPIIGGRFLNGRYLDQALRRSSRDIKNPPRHSNSSFNGPT
jgi:hypothetical protein